MPDSNRLLEAHERLVAHYDIDRWHWKEDTGPLDICLGAILVQHTAWGNVEKAIDRLRSAGAHSIDALLKLTEPEIGELIRPAGTPVGKSRRLKVFAELVTSHGGFEGLFDRPMEELRTLLLGTYGIGPETADVIVLYAAKQPGVVHDAYTARLCGRLGIGPSNPTPHPPPRRRGGGDRYEDWRAWLDATLPYDLDYRRRNHAAIVVHCKELCRTKPRCASCPLREICEYARVARADGA
jgi:endonuclease-3 related protein